ncbi:MAG: hypothetical protein AMJ45_06490 [Syntrophobacter sp. DG_60]|nr:MAG: hypothetical protein AMJ45_06490 [Syntrophobacter sp. DG_60]
MMDFLKGIAENENFKIFEGQTEQGKMWAIHLKGAKASFHLGSVGKVLFVKTLCDFLEKSKTIEQKCCWVRSGYGVFSILVSVADAEFLVRHLPMSEAERKLCVEKTEEYYRKPEQMH